MFKLKAAGRAVANALKVDSFSTQAVTAIDKIIPLPLPTEIIIFEEYHGFVEQQIEKLFPNSAFLGNDQMTQGRLTKKDCETIRERMKDSVVMKQNQHQVTELLHRVRKHVVMDKGKDFACNMEDIVAFSEKLFDMQKKMMREIRREAERQAMNTEKTGRSSPSSPARRAHRIEEVRKMSEAPAVRVCNQSRPVRAAAVLSVCGFQSKNFGRLKPNPSDAAKTHFSLAIEDFTGGDNQPTFAMLSPSLDHRKPSVVSKFNKMMTLPGRVHELGEDDALDKALAAARGSDTDMDTQPFKDPMQKPFTSFGGNLERG